MSQQRAEDLTDIVFWFAGVFYVLAAMLPIIVIGLIGLATGTSPTEAQGGILGVAAGYPAFNPQTWLLFLPAIAALFLAVWTFPLPLRRFPGTSRGTLAGAFLFAFIATLVDGFAFHGAPGIANEGVWAAFVFLLAWAIVAARTLLGWLRLLPRAWREAAPTASRRSRSRSGAGRKPKPKPKTGAASPRA